MGMWIPDQWTRVGVTRGVGWVQMDSGSTGPEFEPGGRRRGGGAGMILDPLGQGLIQRESVGEGSFWIYCICNR